jgi:hypothetical protein
MKTVTLATTWLATLLAGSTLVWAGSRSGGSYAVNDIMDGGGQAATNGACALVGSIGGIVGVCTAAPPTETVKHGYIGQLTEVSALSVTSAPASVNEGATSQLSGLATLDDDSQSVLGGGDMTWGAATYPLASITASGLVTAAAVYGSAAGQVSGNYLGTTGGTVVLVLDVNPDNFGLYAGDGVPDGWQVQYFGVNNPLGMAGATNCSGQNNLYTYTADLDPTNPASCFKIVALSNEPPSRVVYFLPASTGRVYALQFSTGLASGAWTHVTPLTNWGNGGVYGLGDTNTASPRYYRVGVQVP